MDIGRTKERDLNKAFHDVETSLENLCRAAGRDVEEDAFSRHNVDVAIRSLKTLRTTLEGGPLGEEYLGKTRKVLGLINSAMNDTALATALGSMQVEFSGILRSVQQLLYPDDTKRAKKVDLDPLRK